MRKQLEGLEYYDWVGGGVACISGGVHYDLGRFLFLGGQFLMGGGGEGWDPEGYYGL